MVRALALMVLLAPAAAGFARSESPRPAELVYGSVRTDVYVVRTDGAALRRLTANPGYDLAPSWRP